MNANVPEATTYSDYTLLVETIRYNRPDVFNSLLRRNASAYRVEGDRFQSTLLHLAARMSLSGVPGYAEKLIWKGFEINAQDSSYRTPIHYSIIKGKLYNLNDPYDTFDLLVRRRANVRICDYWGRTPLHQIILHWPVNSCERIQWLMSLGANIEARDQLRGYTPLHYAIECNDYYIIDVLLKFGANINARTVDKNWTPLHVAVSLQETIMWSDFGTLRARILLDEKADIEAIDIDRSTPLHLAVKLKRARCVKLLLRRKANVNACNKFFNTPLLLAIYNKSYEIVKAILEYQPDTNDKRVLALAINSINEETFEEKQSMVSIRDALIDYGFTFHGNHSMDSLWLALKFKNYERVKLLIKSGLKLDRIEDSEGFLLEAVRNNREDLVELLIRNGVSIYSIENILMPAVELQAPSMVKLLLDYGADPNRNWSKDTGNGLLHSLVGHLDTQRGQEILRILLEHGADINFMNTNFETPLDLAFEMSPTSASTLLRNGADINIGESRCAIESPKEPRESMISIINKLHIAGSFVTDFNIYLLEQFEKKYSHLIRMNEDYVIGRRFEEKCLKEVRKMEQFELMDGHSLHDIFVKKVPLNRIMINKLEKVNFSEYPEYGDLLANRLCQEKKPIEALNRAKESFNFLLMVSGVIKKSPEQPRRLPDELVIKIISQLDEYDQHDLALCGQILKKQLLG